MKANHRNQISEVGPITDVEEFKRFLGPMAAEYNDAQLRQLQRDMHIAAELLLDMYLSRKRGTAKPVQINAL